VRGLDGKEVVFVDRNCELVLCIDDDLHPQHTAIQENMTLRTSDTRKNALRLAYEFYERCSGDLKLSQFNIAEESKQLGLQKEEDAQAHCCPVNSGGMTRNARTSADFGVQTGGVDFNSIKRRT
jgi:hypothetical protein